MARQQFRQKGEHWHRHSVTDKDNQSSWMRLILEQRSKTRFCKLSLWKLEYISLPPLPLYKHPTLPPCKHLKLNRILESLSKKPSSKTTEGLKQCNTEIRKKPRIHYCQSLFQKAVLINPSATYEVLKSTPKPNTLSTSNCSSKTEQSIHYS